MENIQRQKFTNPPTGQFGGPVPVGPNSLNLLPFSSSDPCLPRKKAPKSHPPKKPSDIHTEICLENFPSDFRRSWEYSAINGPSVPLVHTNFPRKRYGPMIGPYEFPQKLVWSTMDQCRSKFSESYSLDRHWSIECSSQRSPLLTLSWTWTQ